MPFPNEGVPEWHFTVVQKKERRAAGVKNNMLDQSESYMATANEVRGLVLRRNIDFQLHGCLIQIYLRMNTTLHLEVPWYELLKASRSVSVHINLARVSRSAQ